MLFYKAISYVFHPVVFSIISTLLYFIILPTNISKKAEHSILIIVFLSTYIVPILLLFFLKRFKMVQNYQLSSIEERKFPILFMIVLFSLLGKTLLDTGIVDLLAYSFLGCGISMFLVYLLFFMNLKTSLHTLSIAGLIAFISVISFQYELNLLLVLILLFLLFGVIALSRLKLKAHTPIEVYVGFIIGALPQIIVYYLFVRYSI